MNPADRLARRQRIRKDLGALAGIALFVLLMLTIIVLPGILTEDATSRDAAGRAMIRQFLDVSSGHLSPATWAWLDAQFADDVLRDGRNDAARQLAGGPTRHGWFVYAPEDPCEGVPADLAAVLADARNQNAEYVLFDCDALPNQDLPVLHPLFAVETEKAIVGRSDP